MDEQSLQFVLLQLDASEAELLAALEGAGAEEAAFRPAAGAWSIAENVEHLATIEHLSLLVMRRRAAAAPAPLVRREHSAAVFRAVGDRTNRIEAPARVRPTGQQGGMGEGLASLREARRELRAYVAGAGDELDARSFPHPLLGELTNYEWALATAGHMMRHRQQILEIREQWRAAAAGLHRS